MPHPHRRRFGPKPDRRRALEFLAAAPDGCTEALMFANGFTAELLIELVRAGLASAHAERMVEMAYRDPTAWLSAQCYANWSRPACPPVSPCYLHFSGTKIYAQGH
jgi:hypothetical protein